MKRTLSICGTVVAGISGRLRNERGYALVLALAASVALSIAGTSIAYYTTSNSHQASRGKAADSAYGLAEAGLNNALSILGCASDDIANPCTPAPTKLANDPTLFPSTPPATPQITLDGGTAVYSGVLSSNGTNISSGTCSDPCIWKLTSTGTKRGDGLAPTVRKTLTRTVTVNGINDGADGGSWSRFYQDSASTCLTIDTMTFVTNVSTKGDLCIRDTGAITGVNTVVDVGGNVSIQGPPISAGSPRSPSAATGTTWTTPTNVYTNNGAYATYNVATGGNSNNLDATGFGFTVPTSAIIRGISVTLDRKGPASPTNSIKDNTFYLLKAGAQAGSNKAYTSNYWGTSDATQSYGSSTDLWGTTWTAAQVNAANFGVRLSVHNFQSSAAIASIDQITVTVTYTNDTNGIGTSTTSIATANIGGSCSYNANTAHTPCTSVDHVYAGTITNTPAATNPALEMPQVDFDYWWANAKPGPKHFCTNANPGLPTNFFDNDAGTTSAPNKSITINGEMAPANSSYDCQFVENGQLVGQLKWNNVNHRLDIKGVIFVDGNFRFDEDGQIIHYYGRANIMSSRDDEIDALVCAGGPVDGSGNPTGNTYSTSCLPNMSNWDQSQNMMVLMSQMPNEYDQGGTTCSGSPYNCYNGHLVAGFQGIMFSESDCMIHQNFQDSGPVICNTITLPDEGGVNPTFYTFPYIGNLTDGQKYGNVQTATHFGLALGSQSG